MGHPSDGARSGRMVVVSHCILNQNAPVRGGARFPGAMTPLVGRLLESGVGLYQMPCPEMSYCGVARPGQVRSQYDTPMFRRHCQRLAESVLDDLQDYHRNGYDLLGIVMIDGSPSCGLDKTCEWTDDDSAPDDENVEFVDGPGVYCEVLQAEAERRGLGHLPYVAVPELEDAQALSKELQKTARALL